MGETMKRVQTKAVQSKMWANGMPCSDDRYANVFRAALKAGLDERQAYQITRLAFDAANGFEWKLPEGSDLRRVTRDRIAGEHPNGKVAEEIAAQREGRASRWGTPEFHGAK